MRWPKPRDSFQTSFNIRSRVFGAKARQLVPSELFRTRAASRYADTNIAFQETYNVLSMNGVGRGRRAASIFPFAFALVWRTTVGSRTSCVARSAATLAVHR